MKLIADLSLLLLGRVAVRRFRRKEDCKNGQGMNGFFGVGNCFDEVLFLFFFRSKRDTRRSLLVFDEA